MADEDVSLAPEHGVVTTDPQVPQSAVDRAVETLRELAGWHIWPVREERLELLVPGDGQVILPTKRLLEVIELSIDGSPIDIDRLVYSDDGVVYVPGLKPRRDDVPRKVIARIRHGYEKLADLTGVVLAMAARSVQPQASYTVGRISVGAPGSATPQSTEWRLLDLYKLGARP